MAHDKAYLICENKCFVEAPEVAKTGSYNDLKDKPTEFDVYSKAEVNSLLAGKANASHGHSKDQISGLPVFRNEKGTLSTMNVGDITRGWESGYSESSRLVVKLPTTPSGANFFVIASTGQIESLGAGAEIVGTGYFLNVLVIRMS